MPYTNDKQLSLIVQEVVGIDIVATSELPVEYFKMMKDNLKFSAETVEKNDRATNN